MIPSNEPHEIIHKLESILLLVESISENSIKIKKIRNYPFDLLILDIRWAINLEFVDERGLQYLMVGVAELYEYLKKSRNNWLKNRVELIYNMFKELIEGNYLLPMDFELIVGEKFEK